MTHHRPARSRPLAAALACLTVAVLAACHDSDVDPPPASRETPSTPTVAKPTEASATSFGAEAFERYEDLLYTGETDAFAALTLPSCRSCQEVVKASRTVREKIAHGAKISGDAIVIRSSRTEIMSSSGGTVAANYRTSVTIPEVTFSAPGESPSTRPAEDVDFVFSLRWRVSEWKIAEVERS